MVISVVVKENVSIYTDHRPPNSTFLSEYSMMFIAKTFVSSFQPLARSISRRVNKLLWIMYEEHLKNVLLTPLMNITYYEILWNINVELRAHVAENFFRGFHPVFFLNTVTTWCGEHFPLNIDYKHKVQDSTVKNFFVFTRRVYICATFPAKWFL